MNKKIHGRAHDSVEVVPEAPKSEVAKREESILAFWQEQNIFEKTVATPAGNEPDGDFVFYDGPPFATGLPHYGHILAGTMKDAIPRFWTMNGKRVKRVWGWDCHGLPLENLIEKELGLATKRDIEDYGVKNFNEKARGAVLRYADDWAQIVPRMGRFVDMKNDYRTMDSSYTESVWWVFKQLHEKGLVYEGFKSMHLCPRCGTTLSNFEVNQGYQDIKDIAVTVRLPLVDETGVVTDTSLLVWTTTPWTLPGNTAAAVHNELTYVTAKLKGVKPESVILAKGRLEHLGDQEYEIVEEFPGSQLVGRKYQPPYPWLQQEDIENKDKAWTIYHADYVEEGEEGTGAVHIAPAYGEDDMNLAKENDVPIHHHVAEDGRFKPFVKDFAGQLVKPKDDEAAKVTHLDADILVTRSLNEIGKLFKKENITHSYPHCWRCDTPLLNYATTSWFVEVTKMKDTLVNINEGIRWVPEHVGKNRFGKWLEGARDWAVSRQRYWGAPLPIWKNSDTGDYKVFGSLEEMQEYVPKSGNTYFTMRHGESEKNVISIVTDDPDAPYPLTEKGKVEAIAAAKSLKEIDLIYTSPVLRARETAAAIALELGLPESRIIIDERIKEADHGSWEGKSLEEFFATYPNDISRFENGPEDGENWTDIKKRTAEFLFDLENTHQGKRILVVSHGDPLALMRATMKMLTKKETVEYCENDFPQKGSAVESAFTPFPHNEAYELDFHRPYIDEFELYEDGVKLVRVPDVFDCWFESGSMPYAQHHYPFENKEQFLQEDFPAQFIAEGLDQTRGWFYSMLVLGVALFNKSPYENVIVNGLVLAEDGKKMSKSLQNYPDPMELASRTGVDAMRFYLLASPVIKGEDLNFSEKEVEEIQRKNISRLHNVLQMFEMFSDGTSANADSEHVLDRWIISRLNQLIVEVTDGYKNYELDKATRPVTDFIDDLSVWYLRRSRDRLKGEDEGDKQLSLGTLRCVLKTLALVMAPVMPFYAEYLWRAVKSEEDAESVHLGSWPESGTFDEDLLKDMETTREVVTAALEARTKAGIKVRQPLGSLVTNQPLTPDFTNIIAEEVNVKVVTSEGSDLAVLDVTLTPELQAEGAVRELMRAVQSARKQQNLEPADRINLAVHGEADLLSAVDVHRDLLVKTVGATAVEFREHEGEEVKTAIGCFVFKIEKV